MLEDPCRDNEESAGVYKDESGFECDETHEGQSKVGIIGCTES